MLLEIGLPGFDAPLKAMVAEGQAPAKGEEVGVEVSPEGVLVFPAEKAPADGWRPAATQPA